MFDTQVMIASEDSTFSQRLCAALALSDGLSIAGVHTSGAGLMDAIRQKHPDVLLIDLMLPGVNTLTILNELSQLPASQQPAIYVLSSFASSETVAECDRLGVSFFLRKPVDIPSLIDLISREVSGGNLTVEAEPKTADEMGELTAAYGETIRNLRGLIQDIQRTASDVSTFAEQLTENASQSAQATQQVATSITNVAASSSQQGEAVSRSLDDIHAMAQSLTGFEHTAASSAAATQEVAVALRVLTL